MQIFDPRKAEVKNLDFYDGSNYTKETRKSNQILPMVQEVCQNLCNTIVK